MLAMPRALLPAFVATSILALLPASQSTPTRMEVPDANYASGYLAWSDGGGAISWSAPASLKDPGGPPAPPSSEWDVLNKAGLAEPVVDEFLSSPVPRTLFINGARLIQVDLYLTKCSGYYYLDPPRYRVEILAGDHRLASAHAPSEVRTGPFSNPQYAPAPQVPAGFCIRMFRMQAELDTIPTGSVVKVRILHEKQSEWHQYGMGEGHASVLRIPTFPPEEAAFRFPGTGGGFLSPPSASGSAMHQSSDEATWSIPVLLAGLLFGPRPSRPATKSAVMACLLVPAALSGCVGGDPSDAAGGPQGTGTDQKVRTYLQADRENSTGLVNETTGSLAGVVRDDLWRPVKGASALLEGTSHFGETDNLGRFLMTGIPPGRYRLHLAHKDHQAKQADVVVEAQGVTRVEVMMDSTATDRQGSAHPHPKWDGTGKAVLLDDVALPSCNGISCPLDWKTFHVPEDATIYPGTRYVEILINWDAEYLKEVWLNFRPNVPDTSGNTTHVGPRGSGVPFRIATTWEMTDKGHQDFSTWGPFSILPLQGSMQEEVLQPIRFRVTLAILEGVVPLEPAHEDWWKGRATATIVNASRCAQAQAECGWAAEDFVPPGTTHLELILKGDREVHQVIDLRVKTGNMPPGTGFDKWRKPTVVRKEGPTTAFRLDLLPAETDPFYSAAAGFFFSKRRPDAIGDPVGYAEPGFFLDAAEFWRDQYTGPYTGYSVNGLTLTVTAYRGD